jgi:hypothetical protein
MLEQLRWLETLRLCCCQVGSLLFVAGIPLPCLLHPCTHVTHLRLFSAHCIALAGSGGCGGWPSPLLLLLLLLLLLADP